MTVLPEDRGKQKGKKGKKKFTRSTPKGNASARKSAVKKKGKGKVLDRRRGKEF